MTRPRLLLSASLSILITLHGLWQGTTLRDRFSAGGEIAVNSPSAQAIQILQEDFELRHAHPIAFVFSDEKSLKGRMNWKEIESEIQQLAAWTLIQTPELLIEELPLVSPDETTAIVLAHFDSAAYGPTELTIPKIKRWTNLYSKKTGIHVDLLGMAPLYQSLKEESCAELISVEVIGIPLTFILLTLSFGNWQWALVTGGLSIVSILGTLGFLGALMHCIPVAHYCLNASVMLGFALTTDYSLIWLYRYSESHHANRTGTIHSATRTVWIGGLTVAGGFVALSLAPHDSMKSIAYAGMILTLLSTFLVTEFMPWLAIHLPPPRQSQRSIHFWKEWSEMIGRHPLRAMLAGILLLALCFLPGRYFSLGTVDRQSLAARSHWHDIETWVRMHLPSFPLDPVLFISRIPLEDQPKLEAAKESVRRIFNKDPLVIESNLNLQKGICSEVWMVDNRTRVVAAQSRIQEFRDESTARGWPIHVTGPLANTLDIDEDLWRSLPRILAIVFAFHFITLAIAFRSILIPVKAIVLNSLIISATGCLLSWLFCTPTGASLVNVPEGVGLNAFVMLLLVATIFSLSMDYEVFLISRMSELYRQTGQHHRAVTSGIANTGRVVTRAGMIMISVFLIFSSTSLIVLKQFGIGMAIAIFLDITVARLLIVPACMLLIGERIWWPHLHHHRHPKDPE